jgi:hypothetical protein
MSEFTICEDCGQHMDPGTSCTVTHVAKGPKSEAVPRVRVGDGGDWTIDTCHDCNAPVGGFHHGGCDTERCPGCGNQMLLCFGGPIEGDEEFNAWLATSGSCQWQYIIKQEVVHG